MSAQNETMQPIYSIEISTLSSLIAGNTYTRIEVQEAIGKPDPTTSGDWGTGYTEYNGIFYIFANVDSAGGTGHDYPNRWVGDSFEWPSKNKAKIDHPQSKRLLSPNAVVRLFTRNTDRAPFVYQGTAVALNAWGEKPFRVVWERIAST